MRLVRCVSYDGSIVFGELESDDAVRVAEGDPFTGGKFTDRRVAPKKLLAPLVPTQIWGVGLNYRTHAIESGMAIPEHPVVFAKGINSLQNTGDPIVLPSALPTSEVDYECELAVVIGKEARNVAKEDALDYVRGYTCANDVSARDWQLRLGGGQWSRGKTFDTFCPLGPVLLTPDELGDPSRLQIRTRLNGEVVQDASTSDMIFDVPTLIEFLSASTTLLAGTVILTGTPHGVGMASKPPRWLHAGDEVIVEIDGIGSLRNPVVAEVD